MKRISSLSFLAVLAGAVLPAHAQFKDYRFFEAASAPATLNDVTFDGTRFWAVGDSTGLLRSGEQADGPGVRGLTFTPLVLTGVSNKLTAVIPIGPSNLAIGAGTGELTSSVGSLYRIPAGAAGSSVAAVTVPESPSLNLGQVTDLSLAGTNLIRFGNRFAVGRYSTSSLNSANPTQPDRTADISPFFEDYQTGVLIGSNLILAGQYRGDALPRGAISLSRDFGLTNAPSSAVTLFGTNETARIQTVGGDGTHLYVSGPTNFVAVLEGAAGLTSLPSSTNTLWKKATNGVAGINAIVPHGGVLFVAGADGIHQRSPGAAFLTTKEKPSNLAVPVKSLAVATTGALEDLVVGVSGSTLVVGGPVPDPAIVGGFRLHFIDSDLSNVVNISNLITASTTSQRSVAFDVYKIADGVNVGKVITVGPTRSSAATGFDLVSLGTSNFNYGTNVFEIASRDVRTGIEGARVRFTAFRWPNPQFAHLGRAAGVNEPNHFFQLGADYANSPVPSFLFVTNQVINNGRGQNLDVPVASANWFQLAAPAGQSVDGTNPVVASTTLAGLTAIATDVDRLDLSSLPTLPPGVHTFAVQTIAKFPTDSGTTNALGTNVTRFNVVVLQRPTAPVLDWTFWETGACVGTVANNLLPSLNGDWPAAMAAPAGIVANDLRLVANISRANWPELALNALTATLPVDQNPTTPSTRVVQVQSVSNNRDGLDALSAVRTEIRLVSRPTPQPPALSLTGVLVGVDGVPTSRDFSIPTTGTTRIQVGEGVVGSVVVRPTPAIETFTNNTVVTWVVSATDGGVTAQTGGDFFFAQPFDLTTQTPGLYRLTARSSNSYTNARVAGGVTNQVVQSCSSPALTTIEVEVRQRPPAPVVTVAGVGVYNDGSIQYVDPADSSFLVIGQDATRPQYRVTPGQIPGIGGTQWQTADWVLITASGLRTNLASNSATFTPPVNLTAALLGNGPSTNQILAFARSLDGSVGLVPRVMTLVVTPPPAAPDLLAGGFFRYDGTTLVAQTDVTVANGSTLTIAGSLPGTPDHRPTYSMVAQGTTALVADWYLQGTTNPIVRGVATFRPTAEQSPVGTNGFFAIARSTEGSQSATQTTFQLIVTGVPETPGLSALDVQRFDASGNFVSTDGVAVVPVIRVTDLVRNLVTEAGALLRPEFLTSAQDNSDGADWYRVVGAVRTLVAVNSPLYRPSALEAPLGTNTYEVVARSREGAASAPATLQLVVTGPTQAPSLSVGQFFLFQGGAPVRQDDVVLPANGTTVIADILAEQPALRRPIYRLTGPADAVIADWYQVSGASTNLVAKNSLSFAPSVAQTPVGSHTFVAVARSAEGAISPVTTFTLVVTAVPVAPSLAAGDFLLPDAQGVPTLQNGVAINPPTPLVVGDNAGDEARRRPQFSLSPLGANVVSADWYQVVAGATNLVSANSLTFRPSVGATPVGSHVFLAVARSTQGASSVPTRFTLTVTGAPSEPLISGQIPSASADGLTLSNSDGDLPINPGDVFSVGTKAAQQFNADGSFRFTVNDGENLKASFTRWSVNGTAVATNQTVVPVLPTGTNTVSLLAFSQDGTAGVARAFTVIVTPAPTAPTVTPVLATRASCDTSATFTAQVASDVRTIVWTSGPESTSSQLLVGAAFTSPANQAPSATSYKYFAWAVTANGDWSPVATLAELVVVPAPPAAELVGGTADRAIALNAASYPSLTVSNLGENRVEWFVGGVKIGEGSPFTPTTNQFPSSLAGPVTNNVREAFTHVFQAVMIRENCTNGTTTVAFKVIMPWVDVAFDKANGGVLSLQLNAVDDLATRTVTLHTDETIAALVPESGLTNAGTSIVLTDPLSTNAGVRRYFLQSLTNLTNGSGFFRVVLP